MAKLSKQKAHKYYVDTLILCSKNHKEKKYSQIIFRKFIWSFKLYTRMQFNKGQVYFLNST